MTVLRGAPIHTDTTHFPAFQPLSSSPLRPLPPSTTSPSSLFAPPPPSPLLRCHPFSRSPATCFQRSSSRGPTSSTISNTTFPTSYSPRTRLPAWLKYLSVSNFTQVASSAPLLGPSDERPSKLVLAHRSTHNWLTPLQVLGLNNPYTYTDSRTQKLTDPHALPQLIFFS